LIGRVENLASLDRPGQLALWRELRWAASPTGPRSVRGLPKKLGNRRHSTTLRSGVGEDTRQPTPCHLRCGTRSRSQKRRGRIFSTRPCWSG